MTLYGKKDLKIKIVSVYGPHESGGPKSAYAQQRVQLLEMNDHRHPKKAFWEDLGKRLEKWSTDGFQIIVGSDWNKCSNHENLELLLSKYDLKECFRELHGTPKPT